MVELVNLGGETVHKGDSVLLHDCPPYMPHDAAGVRVTVALVAPFIEEVMVHEGVGGKGSGKGSCNPTESDGLVNAVNRAILESTDEVSATLSVVDTEGVRSALLRRPNELV